MQPTQRPYVILSAFVFDETGDNALAEAVRLAQRVANAELHVVHVSPNVSLATREATLLSGQLAPSQTELEQHLERACAGTEVTIRAHMSLGSAADVILAKAAELEADMLVLGSHQRRGLEKLVLGSVSERVTRDARCPVVLAMPKSWEPRRETDSIEPPCPECTAVQAETRDPARWCERHSHARVRPHVYEPSDRASSILGK